MERVRLQLKLPADIVAQTVELVRDGWYRDTGEVIVDALRQLMNSLRPCLSRSM